MFAVEGRALAPAVSRPHREPERRQRDFQKHADVVTIIDNQNAPRSRCGVVPPAGALRRFRRRGDSPDSTLGRTKPPSGRFASIGCKRGHRRGRDDAPVLIHPAPSPADHTSPQEHSRGGQPVRNRASTIGLSEMTNSLFDYTRPTSLSCREVAKIAVRSKAGLEFSAQKGMPFRNGRGSVKLCVVENELFLWVGLRAVAR